jgi:hypothetical protein
MAKKKAEVVPEKRQYLIPVPYLAELAHQFAKLRPDEPTILNRLKELWIEATDNGYQRHISDQRLFRNKRDARIKNSCDSFIQNIEDLIHGGVVAKKETSDNQQS